VDVELPDGERFWHHMVRLHRAAMMVLLDDQDRALLLWRHRFVQDLWGWELPGGLIDEGEEPAETAALSRRPALTPDHFAERAAQRAWEPQIGANVFSRPRTQRAPVRVFVQFKGSPFDSVRRRQTSQNGRNFPDTKGINATTHFCRVAL
jgi:8-oxo-dGTP pyrophosphatase MutT (NUDIX family)